MTSITGKKSVKGKVNLEWWDEKDNLGDYLSVVVYRWLLRKERIDPGTSVGKTKHLMGIGSVIGMGNCDATIWGSGIHTSKTIGLTFQKRRYRKYDIRLVRGPITRNLLMAAGYDCPKAFGDPAVLMKKIFPAKNKEKVYATSVIKHVSDAAMNDNDDIHYIDIATHDYENVINQILKSKKIISSSLHGIIISETYGIPAIFLDEGISSERMKFFDWYLSTGRTNIQIAHSLSEALMMKPMDLPNLEKMQREVWKTFPYDLWK